MDLRNFNVNQVAVDLGRRQIELNGRALVLKPTHKVYVFIAYAVAHATWYRPLGKKHPGLVWPLLERVKEELLDTWGVNRARNYNQIWARCKKPTSWVIQSPESARDRWADDGDMLLDRLFLSTLLAEDTDLGKNIRRRHLPERCEIVLRPDRADLVEVIRYVLPFASRTGLARPAEAAGGDVPADGLGVARAPGAGRATGAAAAWREWTKSRPKPTEHEIRALFTLAALNAPVSAELLGELSVADAVHIGRVVETWGQPTPVVGAEEPHWVCHEPLRDLIRRQDRLDGTDVSLTETRKSLASMLQEVLFPSGKRSRKPSDEKRGLALREIPKQLLLSGQLDLLAGLLLNPDFLEAKTEAGMVFQLVEDMSNAVEAIANGGTDRHMLSLLKEALQRDAVFISEHRTALFQCLWNTCWWYDCPEAGKHLFPADGETPAGTVPWEEDPPKLSAWMEQWREAWESKNPRFPWLRSLRPPALPLGTDQTLVLRGHTHLVTCMALSRDNRWIVTGARDGAVRLWNATTGECIRKLDGPGIPLRPSAIMSRITRMPPLVPSWASLKAATMSPFRLRYPCSTTSFA